MTIPTVAVDDPILADTMNALINNVNGSPYRAIFTSSGSWTIPQGVQKFKVTLAGGGGRGGASTSSGGSEGEFTVVPGGNGGTAPMISAIFTAGSPGTGVAVTVGAAGTSGGGGTSSCNGLISTGGAAGGTGGTVGSNGTATFPPGAPAAYHTNGLYCPGPASAGYGAGGPSDGSGLQGIVVIEW